MHSQWDREQLFITVWVTTNDLSRLFADGGGNCQTLFRRTETWNHQVRWKLRYYSVRLSHSILYTLAEYIEGELCSTGDLNRNESENGFGGYYPNDEFGFRSNWFARNKITSLNTSRNRVMWGIMSRFAEIWKSRFSDASIHLHRATCLGPPAQAIVGTTMNTISLA